MCMYDFVDPTKAIDTAIYWFVTRLLPTNRCTHYLCTNMLPIYNISANQQHYIPADIKANTSKSVFIVCDSM